MKRLLFIVGLAILMAACTQQGTTVDVDRVKAIAGELRDNKLYEAAIEEYNKLLATGSLSDADRGRIHYLIARIYFEDLQDYDNAAAYYIRAKEIDPNANYQQEAAKNLVAALERGGKLIDASRNLRSMTDIDASDDSPSGGTVVARIGQDSIFMAEIEERIQRLPRSIQQQLTSRQARIEFLRSYVGRELLYRAAVREGYDREPAVRQQQEELLQEAIVDAYVSDKVFAGVQIDTADIRNFYTANKATVYNNMPFDSVRSRVVMDYQQQKAEAALNSYVQRLIEVERPVFYEKNVR